MSPPPPPPPPQEVYVEGEDVVPGVWEVLDKIKGFTGGWLGAGGWCCGGLYAVLLL